MNPFEYETMARVEDEHWWYRGLRHLFAELLKTALRDQSAVTDVLDIGCGTGANLKLLQEVLQPMRLAGFDNSSLAVAAAGSKVPRAEVYRSDICDPEMRQERLDVILCSDVLYMTELDRALPGLRMIVDRLKPGGILLLHLPALNWLYSQHDQAVHTRHRFTRKETSDILGQLGLATEVLTYRMTLLFPAVVAARLPSLVLPRRRPDEEARSDLQLPSPTLNRLLYRLVQLENQWILHGGRWPIGSSLIAVGRKR